MIGVLEVGFRKYRETWGGMSMNAFNKLRFVIQSALLLGILRLTLKVLPGLKVYLKSTVPPLALAGITVNAKAFLQRLGTF